MKGIIVERLAVVSITLGSDDNPYLVFESLNAKGERLTQADLIRNFFFLKIHTDHQEDMHTRYWLPMQEALGVQLTEFIRHYLDRPGRELPPGRFGVFPPQGDVSGGETPSSCSRPSIGPPSTTPAC